MNGEVLVQQAYKAILDGDYERAIALFEEAILLEPSKASHYYKCSITCTRSGKWEKAYSYARQALELEPEQIEHRYQVQMIEAKLLIKEAEQTLSKDPSAAAEAIAKLRRAAELDPLNTDSMLMLGALYHSLGLYYEARGYAEEALQLEPLHPAANRLYTDSSSRLRLERGTGRFYFRRMRRRNR